MFSFVIPVYNVKIEFLKTCVESIEKNIESEWEIVLIDDHSDNGCKKQCDLFQSLDKRIRVIHQLRNRGVSEARNIGVKNSIGDWIIFVDADDWVEFDICSVLSKYTSKSVDVIMFSAYRDSVAGLKTFGMAENVKVFSIGGDEESMQTLENNIVRQNLKTTPAMYETIKYCWGKCFRKQFLIDSGLWFPNLNYCEDIIFMYQVFQHAQKVIQIPARLYHYRIVDGSTVHSFRENALTEQKTFLCLLEESIKEGQKETLFYAALLSMQICITKYFYARENKMNLFIRHYRTRQYFSQWPYSEVFEHVNCNDLKKIERQKAMLIKFGFYFIYNLCTQVRLIADIPY